MLLAACDSLECLSSLCHIAQNAAKLCTAPVLLCPWPLCEACICLHRCIWGQESEAVALHQQTSGPVVPARCPLASMSHIAAGAVQGLRAHGSSRNHTVDICQKSLDARPVNEALANLKKNYKVIQMAVWQQARQFYKIRILTNLEGL